MPMPLLTINDWLAAAKADDHLTRLLAHTATFQENDPAWILRVSEAHVREQWSAINAARHAGSPLPLYGVPFAVKDNIDVAGLTTTAACPDFAYVAKENAFVVQTLLDAGAILVGKCNLDAFATGLVGTRSPYGAVPNTFDPQYVCGGSSSGSASVVARGLVPFALGTDTAGSGRVPAGFNNIIGLKPTRGALSTRGVVPACRSLDCVSIFTLTIDDARFVFKTCALYDAADPWSRHLNNNRDIALSPRIAICDNPLVRAISYQCVEVDFC
jgi:allophanate hydrolase